MQQARHTTTHMTTTYHNNLQQKHHIAASSAARYKLCVFGPPIRRPIDNRNSIQILRVTLNLKIAQREPRQETVANHAGALQHKSIL